MANSTSWPIEPPSKTSICHVDYELGSSVANLAVVPIRITTTHETKDVQIPILSPNLRRKAITEYLTERGLEQRVAFQLGAHKNVTSQIEDDADVQPINHLVFFESDSKCLKKLKNDSITHNTLSETVKVTKTAGGTVAQSRVRCSLALDQLENLPAQETKIIDYWKMINLLLLSRTKSTVPGMGLKPNVSITRTGSLLQEAISVSKKTGEAAQHTCMADAKITVRGDSAVNILFRTVLKLDPSHHKLRVETDLVAGVKGDTVVSDLAQNMFGRFISGSTNDQYLRQLRTALIGLDVVRTYAPSQESKLATETMTSGRSFSEGKAAITPPRKIKKNKPFSTLSDAQKNARASATKSKPDNNPQKIAQKFSDSIIVDLKPAGDVPRFWKNGVSYSVVKYLRTHYPNDFEGLKSPNLPLANIGKNAWVPLELLKTVGDSSTLQMIPLVGDMTALLQERRLHYHVDAQKAELSKFADALIHGLRSSHQASTAHPLIISDIDQSVRREYKRYWLRRKVFSRHLTLFLVQRIRLLKYGIEPILQVLISSVVLYHGKLNDELRVLNVDMTFDAPVLILPDTNSLLFPPESNPDVKPFYESGLDTIIAIIDDQGRNKKDIRYIRAELQKFGNKKIGAIVQCMTRKELEVRAEKYKGTPARLPIGNLQRVNIMHGNINFAVQPLPPISTRKLLVVGAHISHPGSSSASSCPSVATLVGSVDDALVHYPGSARLQPTLRSSAWRNKQGPPKLKYEMNSKMVDIESMVVERVRAWTAKQGTAEAPHIVFYRHSNQEFDQKSIKDEMAAIRHACAQFDWSEGEATLGYILVNKNAHLASPYHSVQEIEFATNAASEFQISAEGKKEAGYKYQYYVQKSPDDALSGHQYRTLTRHLNANYQPSKVGTVAIALPVHYAQKMAKRMYEYFHFAITNQYDMLSSVQRRLKHPAEEDATNDEQMAEMMNEYLLGYGTIEASIIPEPVRRNPWMKELDDKMFYL
ncbi:hypothetical protein TW65_01833 [Stemphylium lycopersici]|nr:hypothetical protein TW65_01833 [Stemphylium lycopersici]